MKHLTLLLLTLATSLGALADVHSDAQAYMMKIEGRYLVTAARDISANHETQMHAAAYLNREIGLTFHDPYVRFIRGNDLFDDYSLATNVAVELIGAQAIPL